MDTSFASLAIAGTVVAGVLGLLVGSFLNVVVYRVPLGMSVIAPPSSCPHCESSIRAYDNIPVLSWLLLQGRCRDCREPISIRYPLVELSCGVLFACVALWFVSRGGVGIDRWTLQLSAVLALAAFLYLAAISVSVSLIDLATHRIPNRIVLPAYAVSGILIALSALLAGDLSALLRAGAGVAVLWMLYFLLALAYPGGMGLGDVKLAGLLGLYLGYLGWGALLVGGFAAFVAGGVFSITLLIAGKTTRKSGIPFGPWMFVGTWIGIVAGNSIWNGYLSLLGTA